MGILKYCHVSVLRWFSLILICLSSVPALADNSFQVTPFSPIIMRPPPESVLVLADPTNALTFEQVVTKTSEFKPASRMLKPDSSTTYWVSQKIESRLAEDREIRIAPGGGRSWRGVSIIVLDQNGKLIREIESFGAMRGTHSRLTELNPLRDAALRSTSQYAVFNLSRGSTATVYLRLQLDHLYGGATYAAAYYDQIRYLEMRRLGLYIEGALAGIVFALCIFGWFSALKSRDHTGFSYAIWMTVALLSSATQFVHDGQRLFEFFVDIEELRFGPRYLSEVLTNTLAMAQAMTYVYFARAFLDLRERFPGYYQLTNAYLLFYAICWIFVALVEIRAIPQLAVIGPIVVSTVLVLVGFLVCAIIRRREGMKVASFFIVAVIPYLLFRMVFLTALVGAPSPFAALPDEGVGFFIKEATTAQAFGVALEVVIMSLAVVSRSSWLQEELTQSINAQKKLVEDQNRNLELTVATRTRELSEKHQLLEKAHHTVVSSVNYASRLQRGQLPPKSRIERRFCSIEVLWEPRDTIGGDLWWVSPPHLKERFSLAVADCTGHGVPGAMLSLLVSNSLERIYSSEPTINPSTALLSLDHLVRVGLNQDSPDSESDDGCDAAIISIDLDKKILEFAGAKIDLFKISGDGMVDRYKSARISLGYQRRLAADELPSTQQITWNDDDLFVIITDGFTDQVGGAAESPRAFGLRRLEQLLISLSGESAATIVGCMREELHSWQGNQPRRDDVTALVFSPNSAL